MSDPLHDELAALKADIHRVSLADAVAIRRRGDQRRRRRRAGSLAAALAGVVVLGGGVIEIGAAGPEPIQPAHQPDATPTGSSTTTSSPTPTSSPSPTGSRTPTSSPTAPVPPEPSPSLPPPEGLDPLLQMAELPSVGAYEWLPRETYDPAYESKIPYPAETMAACGGDDLSPMMDAEHTMLGMWSTELDASMWEWVAEYATEAEAAAAVETLDARCRTSGQRIDALDNNGFTTAYFGSDPGSEYYGRVTGVARQGNVLVVLEFQAMVTAKEFDQRAFADTVVNAVERAGTALD